jgi:hypothetical protein
MFKPEYRERVRDDVLGLAKADNRVVAGAVVGSLADSEGDRWSDLDLTFGVADDVPVVAVLTDWTAKLTSTFQSVRLFDLLHGASIYRVFLLPGCLQVDLSFTPASQFGATGPKFKLLFGMAVEKPHAKPQAAEELFGYAVHHAVRARFCIERERLWEAEYWLSAVRDYALTLACRRRGLPTWYGRGFDQLPAATTEPLQQALVGSLTREDLLRALGIAIRGLLAETEEVREMADKVEPQLRELSEPFQQVT